MSGEDEASVGPMNPQIRFGEDLMSRVSYVMMNPGGEMEMTRAVREAMGALSARPRARPASTAATSSKGRGRQPDHASPLPRHRPDRARRGAFRARDRRGLEARARDSASTSRPALRLCAALHRRPCRRRRGRRRAREGPHLKDEMTLLVDVGTNAEIVFGNRERLFACSSPTGPAFEGAQISCGQRAAPGAIERVRIDRATLEPRFKVIGCDLWSDEPGF